MFENWGSEYGKNVRCRHISKYCPFYSSQLLLRISQTKQVFIGYVIRFSVLNYVSLHLDFRGQSLMYEFGRLSEFSHKVWANIANAIFGMSVCVCGERRASCLPNHITQLPPKPTPRASLPLALRQPNRDNNRKSLTLPVRANIWSLPNTLLSQSQTHSYSHAFLFARLIKEWSQLKSPLLAYHLFWNATPRWSRPLK
jgi:hypothetical protein